MAKTRATIRGFLASYVEINGLADDDDIFQMGFVNSLLAMQLVSFIERTFSINVEDDDLDMENFKSIQAIVEFVNRKTLP